MGLKERLEAALQADSKIVCLPEEASQHPGRTEKYLIGILGLTKGDLQKLERAGMAIKCYTKNVWLPGETTPRGDIIKESMIAKGSGHRKHWIIILKEVTK